MKHSATATARANPTQTAYAHSRKRAQTQGQRLGGTWTLVRPHSTKVAGARIIVPCEPCARDRHAPQRLRSQSQIQMIHLYMMLGCHPGFLLPRRAGGSLPLHPRGAEGSEGGLSPEGHSPLSAIPDCWRFGTQYRSFESRRRRSRAFAMPPPSMS